MGLLKKLKEQARKIALPIAFIALGGMAYLSLKSDFFKERFVKFIAQREGVELINPSNCPSTSLINEISVVKSQQDDEKNYKKVGKMKFRGDGMLLINNKPFFPIGTFFPVGEDRNKLEETARAGFNTVHDYRFHHGYIPQDSEYYNPYAQGDDRFPEGYFEPFINPFLDEAYRNNLKVLLSFGRGEITCGITTSLEDRIHKFKDHPALLSWYLLDEPENIAFMLNIPAPAMVKRMERLYQKIRSLDQETPVSLLLDPDVVSKGAIYYYDATDIVLGDPHIYQDSFSTSTESPMMEIKKQLEVAMKYAQSVGCKKPRWTIVQAHDIEIHNDKKKLGKEHVPSAREIRCMAYLPLCFGAKGLFFYFPAHSTPESNYEMLGYSSLEKDYPEIYHGVLSIVRELNEIYPFLIQQEGNGSLYVSSNQKICIWSRSNGSEDRVIAVNPLEREVSTEICENKFRRLKEVREISGRNIQPQDNFFSDSFGRYEVRIYKITKE